MSEERRSGSRTLLLIAVFTLTFVSVSSAVFLARRPDLRRRLAERWRWGTESAGGLVMTLEVAPEGSLALCFTNVSDRPRALIFPLGARTGPEIDVVVTDSSGRVVEQHGPVESGAGAEVTIAPGETLRQRLPLEEYVFLQPGRCTIHVERARLRQDDPRLRSNTVSYTKK